MRESLSLRRKSIRSFFCVCEEFNSNLLVFNGRIERMLWNWNSVFELCMLNIAHSLKFMHAHPPKFWYHNTHHGSQHSCSKKCYGTNTEEKSGLQRWFCMYWEKDTFSSHTNFWQRYAAFFSLLLEEKRVLFTRQLW